VSDAESDSQIAESQIAESQAEENLRALHLVVYSDAEVRGGAEVNLSRVLSILPTQIRVTLVGVNAQVLSWLATHRPHTDTVLLVGIRNRTDLRGLVQHRSTFRRLRPDIVQFNLSSASSCQWAILAATTVPGLCRIVIENSPMSVWSPSSALLKRMTCKHLSAHIAVGDRTARMIEESTGLPPGSIQTIYHGVPQVDRVPTARPEEPTMLTVARHDPVKGLDLLLQALALVPEPCKLVLIGEGDQTAALQQICRDLGLAERVEFRSAPWGEARVADMMWAFDGLVLPSRLEGFPVTIVEAMLAGLPVIATQVGSVAEAVVPGLTGWIVPPENPSALAAAMIELLADPARSTQMGIRGQEIAESAFTIEATRKSYVQLYTALLTKPC